MLSENPNPIQPEVDVNFNSSLVSALLSEPATVFVPLKTFSGDERPTIQHKLLVLDQNSDFTKTILPQLIDEAVQACRVAKLQGNEQAVVYVQDLPHIDMHIKTSPIAAILSSPDKHVITDVSKFGFLNKDIWADLITKSDLLLISAVYLLDALRKGYATLDQITMLALDEYDAIGASLVYKALLWEFYYPLPFLSRPFLIGLVKDNSYPSSSDNNSTSRYLCTPLKNSDAFDGTKNDNSSQLFTVTVMPNPEPIFSLNILDTLAQVKGKISSLNHLYERVNSIICELGLWAGCSLLVALLPSYLDNFPHLESVKNQLKRTLLITDWGNQRDHLKEFINKPSIEMMSNKVRSLIDLLDRISCQAEEANKDNYISIIWVPNKQYATQLEFILKIFSKARVSRYSRHLKHDEESGIAIWVVCDLIDLISLGLPRHSNIIFMEPVPLFFFYIMVRLRSQLHQTQMYILFISNNENQKKLVQYIELIESELLTQLNLTKSYLSYHSSQDQVTIQSKLPQYIAPNTNASISILQTEFPIDKLIDHHRESTLPNAFKLEWVSHQTEGEDQIGVVIWRHNIPFVILSKGNSCDGVTRSLVLFQASIFCHENGLLDDFFMPINDRANVRLDRGIKRAKLKSLNEMPNFYKKIPDLWLISEPSLPCRLYFNYIHLPHPLARPFFLATRDPFPQLPPITLFNRNYAEDTIIYPAALPNDILLGDVVKLAEFTQSLFNTILKHSEQCDAASMPFYLAPLMKDMGGLPPPSYTTDDKVLNLSALDWQTISQCKTQSISAQKLGVDLVGQLVTSKKIPYPHTVLNVYSPTDYSVDQLAKVIDVDFTAPFCKPDGNFLPFVELESIPSYTTNCLNMNLLNSDQEDQNYKAARQPIFISLELLRHVHIPRDILQTGYFMPALLSQIEGFLLAMEVRVIIDTPELNISYLLEALTPPSSKAMFDWERFSHLGRKFTNAASSITAFFNPAVRHNLGQMNSYASGKKSFRVITSASSNLNLSRYINLVDINQKKYLPTIFSSSNNRVFNLGFEKFLATLSMAIIGAGVATGGEGLGRKCMMKMGLDICASFWENELAQPQNSLPDNQACLLKDLANIYHKLKYSFNNPLLLQEALTSQSFISRTTDSNLKLAFLGDAVLELLVTSKLLYCYPLMPTCYIDQIKALLVSNNTFTYILVENFLHKHLLCDSSTTAFRFVKDDSFASLLFKPPNTSLVTHLSTFNNIQPRPPKTLADTFEAIMGSIFVDSKLCLAKTLGVLDHLAQKAFHDIMSNIKVSIPEPFNTLTRHFEHARCHGLALVMDTLENEKTHFDFGMHTEVPKERDIGVQHICQLKVHGNILGTGKAYTSSQAKDEVIVEFLRSICHHPDILTKACQCHV